MPLTHSLTICLGFFFLRASAHTCTTASTDDIDTTAGDGAIVAEDAVLDSRPVVKLRINRPFTHREST